LEKYKTFENAFLFLCIIQKDGQGFYFIPFNHISKDELNASFLEPYRMNYGIGVRPGVIHKYLKLETSNLVIRF
jgi:hypothetical protein